MSLINDHSQQSRTTSVFVCNVFKKEKVLFFSFFRFFVTSFPRRDLTLLQPLNTML